MSGDSTVSLNLDGSFESSAESAASAGEKLGAALDMVSGSSARVKAPSGELRRMAADADMATRAMDKLRAASAKAAGTGGGVGKGVGGSIPTALQGSPKMPGGFQQIVGVVGKLFGGGAASGLVSGAAKLASASDALAPFGPLLSSGAGLLKGAGGVVMGAGAGIVTAAAALAAAGAAVTVAGYSFAVQQTSMKETQSAIFEKLGAKGGYKIALKIAADYNLDEGDAIAKMKGLLGAKFSEAEIPAIVKVAVGIGAVKGEEKGKAFLDQLEKNAAKGGKANEEAVKGFAEAGVNVEDVYARMAKKMGVSVAVAKAKVKAGTVDMKDALNAVRESADADFGGIAEKLGGTVPAMLNKLKIVFGSLFDSVDLGPIKDFLKNLLGAFEGPAGGALKGAITELFGALSHAFLDPFKGEEGKKKLERMVTTAANALKQFADAVNTAAPYIAKAIDLLDALFGAHGGSNEDSGVIKALHGFIEAMDAVSNLDPGAAAAAAQKILDALFGTDDASAGGKGIGDALVSGLVDSITGGASGAISAVVSMVEGVISAARGAADAHSPSRKMGALGDDMGDGMVGKLDAANDNASRAGAELAQSAVGGAASATGGAGGGLGAGGPAAGGGIVIQVSVAPPAGMSAAQAGALGTTIGEAVRRELRAVERERGERAA